MTNAAKQEQGYEALRKSEDRYTRAMRGTSDGLWDWNFVTGEDYLSPRGKALLGFAEDELPDHKDSLFSRLLPEDVPHVETALQAHLEKGVAYDIEFQLLTREDGYRWFRSRGQAEWDETGRPLRMAGVLTDIHSTKLMQEQLQEANEALQQMKEHLERRVGRRTQELQQVSDRLVLATRAGNIGIWDWDLINDVLVWDDAMYRLYGITPEQFTGAYAAWQAGVYPEDRARGSEEIELALQGCKEFDTEFRVLWPDGSIHHIKANGLVRRDASGQPIRMLGTNWDITASKLVEEEMARRVSERTAEWLKASEVIQESEERFRRIVETAEEGIWTIDAQAKTSFVNPKMAQMLGYTADEMRGRPLFDFMDEESLAIAEANLERRRRGISEQYDFKFLRKDKSYLWASVTSNALHDAAGVYRGVLGMITDITERKLAAEKIQQLNASLEKRVEERTAELKVANKELEAFSYSISHDLRAPLRAIDGFSRIVMEDFGAQLPPEAQEYLKDIRTNVQQMGDLVSDLLAFSQLGRQPMKMRTIPMGTLVAQCFDSLRVMWDGRQVDFRLGELPHCPADPILLKQVWLNLLTNALKYTGKRNLPIIEIGYQAEDEGWTFFVRDNGVGFDMRYVDKLFGVFQRLHRAEDYEGTGVGLAIVQRIVHRHGGRVWAEAEPDKGAIFFFTLPKKGALSDE